MGNKYYAWYTIEIIEGDKPYGVYLDNKKGTHELLSSCYTEQRAEDIKAYHEDLRNRLNLALKNAINKLRNGNPDDMQDILDKLHPVRDDN